MDIRPYHSNSAMETIRAQNRMAADQARVDKAKEDADKIRFASAYSVCHSGPSLSEHQREVASAQSESADATAAAQAQKQMADSEEALRGSATWQDQMRNAYYRSVMSGRGSAAQHTVDLDENSAKLAVSNALQQLSTTSLSMTQVPQEVLQMLGQQ